MYSKPYCSLYIDRINQSINQLKEVLPSSKGRQAYWLGAISSQGVYTAVNNAKAVSALWVIWQLANQCSWSDKLSWTGTTSYLARSLLKELTVSNMDETRPAKHVYFGLCSGGRRWSLWAQWIHNTNEKQTDIEFLLTTRERSVKHWIFHRHTCNSHRQQLLAAYFLSVSQHLRNHADILSNSVSTQSTHLQHRPS